MDPVTLGVGVLGVVVELYKLSMEMYEAYLSIKDFTPAFRSLRLAIDIERKRLELWAEHMGLEKDSFVNERLRNDPSLLELTKSILTEMTKTLKESAEMIEFYREAEVASPPAYPDQSKLPEYLS